MISSLDVLIKKECTRRRKSENQHKRCSSSNDESHTLTVCEGSGTEKWEGLRWRENSCAANFFNRAWHKFSDTETVFVPEKPVSIENAAQEKLSVNCLDRKLISTLPRHVAPLFLRPKSENEWTIAWDAFLDTSRNKALATLLILILKFYVIYFQ